MACRKESGSCGATKDTIRENDQLNPAVPARFFEKSA
jgi:hypothetical protein